MINGYADGNNPYTQTVVSSISLGCRLTLFSSKQNAVIEAMSCSRHTLGQLGGAWLHFVSILPAEPRDWSSQLDAARWVEGWRGC